MAHIKGLAEERQKKGWFIDLGSIWEPIKDEEALRPERAKGENKVPKPKGYL